MAVENNQQQDWSEQDQRELIESITPDVMGVLATSGFFAALDDRLCPADASITAQRCSHSFELTSSILRAKEFPDEDIGEVIEVLRAQGGFCDCEILYNVAETSRLKTKHWQTRAKELESSS